MRVKVKCVSKTVFGFMLSTYGLGAGILSSMFSNSLNVNLLNKTFTNIFKD